MTSFKFTWELKYFCRKKGLSPLNHRFKYQASSCLKFDYVWYVPKSFHTSSLKTCDICRSIFISAYHLFNVTLAMPCFHGLREKFYSNWWNHSNYFLMYDYSQRSWHCVLLVSEFYDHLITTKLQHGTRAKGQILFNSQV